MPYNMIKHFLLPCLALSLSTTALKAQELKKLSLNDAIQMSLQNSKQLHYNLAKLKEADADVKEAKQNTLPDLKGTASYLSLNNPSVDLKVKLGSGGGGGPISVNSASYAMLNASLPIFAGGKIHYGIEAAKYLHKAAEMDVEKNREDIIEIAISAYGNLFKATEAVEMMKENLRESKQRVEDFKSLEKNGILARNDLLKAELQQSNVELALLDAENNLKLTFINMNLMLGLAEETELVADSSAFSAIIDDGSAISWEQTAFKNRKDMFALSDRTHAANFGIKLAKSNYLPSLALTGGLIALNVPNFITVSNAMNAGLGLSYNFASLWKNQAKVAEARAKYEEMEASKDMLADEIRVQVNQAYENYFLSRKKIEVYNHALEQANENYKITKNKYTNSLATTTDLLDADVAQLQARLNFAFAKVDAVIAYRKLEQVAGVISPKPSKK